MTPVRLIISYDSGKQIAKTIPFDGGFPNVPCIRYRTSFGMCILSVEHAYLSLPDNTVCVLTAERKDREYDEGKESGLFCSKEGFEEI